MTECSICLTNDIEEHTKYTTNCYHNYCKDCLDSWFDRGNQSCPLCRQPIQYYIYLDNRYRLVFYNHSQEIVPRPPYIMMKKRICISSIIILGVLLQLCIIYYLYEQYNHYKQLYLYNIHETNKYNL